MIGRFKCEYCKNFLENQRKSDVWKCKAFPDGIPEMKLAFISRDPCDNCNNGIGFELDKNND